MLLETPNAAKLIIVTSSISYYFLAILVKAGSVSGWAGRTPEFLADKEISYALMLLLQ